MKMRSPKIWHSTLIQSQRVNINPDSRLTGSGKKLDHEKKSINEIKVITPFTIIVKKWDWKIREPTICPSSLDPFYIASYYILYVQEVVARFT